MRLILAISCWVVSGWNRVSHEIIAKISANLVSQNAKTRSNLMTLLGENDDLATALMRISNWADDQPESAEYHFTHTPHRNCSPFQRDRDCREDRCLVTGIARYWDVFVNINSSELDRLNALKYIVHLVGDSTQPLHTGFEVDHGGNGIKLSNGISLHEYWDYRLLEAYKTTKRIPEGNSVNMISDYLLSGTTAKIRSNAVIPPSLLQDGMVDPIEVAKFLVEDTVMTATCESAYVTAKDAWIKTGDTLEDTPYMIGRSAVVLKQLLKAGVRLGQVLDAMVLEHSNRKRGAREISRQARQEGAAALVTTPLPKSFSHPNYFEVLFDMDPDSIAISEEEAEQLPPISVPPVQKSMKKAVVSSDESDHRFLDEELVRIEQRLFEGVDLDALVLIKKHDRFIVRFRGLGLGSRMSGKYRLVHVKFGSDPDTPTRLFAIDNSILPPNALITRTLVIAILQKLGGHLVDFSVQGTGERLIDLSRPLSDLDRLFMVIPRKSEEVVEVDVSPKAIEKAGRKLVRQKDRLILFEIGTVLMISRDDLITADLQKIRFSAVALLGADKPATLMYDTRLYDKPISDVNVEVFDQIYQKETNLLLLIRVMTEMPRIMDALTEFARILEDPSVSESEFTVLESIQRIGTNVVDHQFLEITLKR
jgi:hypothetical protein